MLRLARVALLALLCLPAACSLTGPERSGAGVASPSTAAATSTPGAPIPGQGSATPPSPEEPPRPPPRQYHLGPAASALVAQAHSQSAGGHHAEAAATLERALRIEPSNPLLWIELGQLRLDEGNAAQASAMARKALTMASGDARAQASAWRLSAAALRAQGRNAESAEAERRAAAVTH